MLITYQMESLEELLESITSTLQSQYSSRFIRVSNPMALNATPLNGDGLTDIIKTDGSRHMVYLNTGTGYVLHKDGTATVDLDLSQELSQSQSFGMSGNAGATIGIPIFLNGKLSRAR